MLTPSNADPREFLADTTVFVTTVGDEANFRDCLEKLDAQTVRFPLEIIDRIAPMSRAFQEMHERCRTDYYVQVDEDMILYPHAIAELRRRIAAARRKVALYCATLWDCDAEMLLYGVKIYRMAIVRRFPYANTIGCDSEQIERLEARGYRWEGAPLDDRSLCLGEHGKHYSPETIFRRWQRIFQKNRAQGKNDWAQPYARWLFDRYLRTRSDLHLYAALGAIAGIAAELPPDRELDFRDANQALERLKEYFPLV